MKNQPNEMASLDWLLPIIQEKLRRFTSREQKVDTESLPAVMGAETLDAPHLYHQISGALTMANLPNLAHLAKLLSVLTHQDLLPKLTKIEVKQSKFAHQLLSLELAQFGQRGSYRKTLVTKTNQLLEAILNRYQPYLSNHSITIPTAALDAKALAESDILNQAIEIEVPTIKKVLTFQPNQYQKLLSVWHQQCQKLAASCQVDQNKDTYQDQQAALLAPLAKVSQYLWHAQLPIDQQQLWFLTDVWLQNLAHNSEVAPTDFAPILVKLEHIINDYSQPNHESQPLSYDQIQALIADIYINLSLLDNLTAPANQVLQHLTDNDEVEQAFLPRILGSIEAVIFALDDPSSQLIPMAQIKRQLGIRGWSLYAAQAAQILAQLEIMADDANDNAKASDLYWQVERQLQELYSAIYQTEQGIKNKIGTATSFILPTEKTPSAELQFSDDALRQLRIAVEDVKQHFNEYVQRQQPYLLPPLEAFFDIGDAFDDMGLESIRPLTDKLGELIATLAEKEVKPINWQLTQALADSLSAIELILDYLAQQVFDQNLLNKAVLQVQHADQLFDQLLDNPAAINDISIFPKLDHSVVRYDDEGEVMPSESEDGILEDAERFDPIADELLAYDIGESEVDGLTTAESQVANFAISTELAAIHDELPEDDFSMDSDIRDIFIEEAEEVSDELADLVPLWSQNTEDLTPLTEIRRSFHTLKGSGRMVGAFSLGEAAWAIEMLLNRVLDKTLSPSYEVVDLVRQTLDQLPAWVADFAAMRPPSCDPATFILQSQNLLSGKPLMSGLEGISDLPLQSSVTLNDDITAENPVVSEDINDHEAQSFSAKETAPVFAEQVASNSQQKLPQVLETIVNELTLPEDSQDADPDIKEIFIEEAEEVLAEITPLYEDWQQDIDNLAPLTEIRRGFHTLKGSGRMVGACYSGELAWAIENMLNRLLDRTITPSKDLAALVGDVIHHYPTLIAVFANHGAAADYPQDVPLWIACAQAFSKQLGDEFNYQRLINEDLPQTDPQLHSESGLEAPDHVLQACHSAQEIISEALAEIPSQSAEEQAFAAIFIDEAYDLLNQIDEFVEVNKHSDFVEVSDEIVRAFHTLRAAGGASALAAISEVSAAIEQSLEQLQQQDALMDAQHLQAIAKSIEMIDSYLDAYQEDQLQPSDSVQEQSPQNLSTLQTMLDHSEAKSALAESPFSVAELLKIGIDTLLDAECYLRHSLSNDNADQTQFYIGQQQQQIAKLAKATASSPKFSRVLSALAHAYDYLYHHVSAARDKDIQTLLLSGHDQLVGLFDALAGSMSLKVDEQVIAELGQLGDQLPSDSSDEADLQNERVTAAPEASESNKVKPKVGLEDSARDLLVPSVETVQADELSLEVIDTDIELLEIFLEEAQELDNAIAQTFSQWRADKDSSAALKILQRHLHTIKGGARMAGIHSIGDLTHEAESVYEAFVENRLAPTVQWLDIMQTVQDTLSLQIDYVIRYRESFFAADLIAQLQDFIQLQTLPNQITLLLPALQNHLQADEAEENPSDENLEAVNLDHLINQSWQDGLPDPDILEVFLEEADELIVSSNKYLQLFLNNISDIVALQALQRDLHTIKGGARMVGANGIADLAHQMETVYEELAIRRRPATKMIAQLLEACHDWLADALFILKHQINPPMPKALIEALIQFSKNPDSLKQVPSQSLQAELSAVLAAKSKQEAIFGAADISQMPSMRGSFVAQEQSSSNEMIRISSNLIERMINLSGESAINRARIDMGMSSLTNSIEEMGVTIQRLADQLRRMEIELEAQILAQIDDTELMGKEGFDPLEMDQYSSLNQLSKSLTESASDLVDINSTLLEKTRDSENLLLQLSRTQTELQDGLMNSRMVPFARLTPRLERIVRQTANELNKSVELTIVNADDEMDRTILERITSPLEHMLRNAVDHGIESPQERLNLGKERSGQITLEVIREGSEVVIHLTDDGRGINVEAVRQKAISQGLIDANDKSLSDLDVMQYIFNAGLTTTKQVTQISGRGVGMDVVISEIKQLGGLVSVNSQANQGSRFTIRVPLTVAVSDALVVRASDRYYAIPLVQIERVVRVQPEKLFDYYQFDRATMRIDDIDYRIHYLNEILTGSRLNELIVNTNSSLPVIIVKNRTGQNLALQVDQIAGSRIEVVVKPLGRQLSHLAGISAATIMGDGSVMLILDMLALLRNAAVIKDVKQVNDGSRKVAKKSEHQPTILVVDDSVTVRKVTSRFLERQGLTAVVAKDGIDAIEILQELTPDLILLDIEMPRMDGFEVATQIRHNRRLEHIPIIMITSRTGEKHRERAFELGVNDYMGKPFQENQLLDNIQSLLGITLGEVHDG